MEVLLGFIVACFDKENHKHHSQFIVKNLGKYLNETMIPAPKGIIILEGMEFEIKEVVWDLDEAVIMIKPNSIIFGEYEVEEYHQFVKKWL